MKKIKLITFLLIPLLGIGQIDSQWHWNSTPVLEDHFIGAVDYTKWFDCFQWGNDCGGSDTRKFGNDLLILPENLELLPGGGLKILTKNLPASWQPCPAYIYNANYTSGMVMSKQTFQYGRFELRAKLPKGRGINAAFWLFAAPHPNNPIGIVQEIDIFETLSLNATSSSPIVMNELLTTVINDWTNDGHYGDSFKQRYFTKPNIDLTNGFHTYIMEWTPDYLKFYVDGNIYWLMPKKDALFPYINMRLILGAGPKLAPPGNNGGPFINVDAQTFDSDYSDYVIDYVKVNEYLGNKCQSYVITDNDPLFDTQTLIEGNILELATPADIDYDGVDDGPAEAWCYWQNNYPKIIDPSETLNLKAENKIIMYPGFSASAATNGATNFSAIISPCSSPHRNASSSESNKSDEFISNKPQGLNIFPNPSNGQLNVNFENASDTKYNIEVFDVFGKLIYKNEVLNTTGSTFNAEINLENLNLSNGLYLINVNSENQKSSQRIVIEK